MLLVVPLGITETGVQIIGIGNVHIEYNHLLYGINKRLWKLLAETIRICHL